MKDQPLNSMDIHAVLKHLPHRYPFLLIDRVIECIPGKSLVAVKNVSINEPFFPGHFPIRPVMPGVLILEAMAQATGILAFKTVGDQPDDRSLYYLVGVDKARFKKPVEPGDQLRLEVTLNRTMRRTWLFSTEAKVEGQVVASAELLCVEKDIEP